MRLLTEETSVISLVAVTCQDTARRSGPLRHVACIIRWTHGGSCPAILARPCWAEHTISAPQIIHARRELSLPSCAVGDGRFGRGKRGDDTVPLAQRRTFVRGTSLKSWHERSHPRPCRRATPSLSSFITAGACIFTHRTRRRYLLPVPMSRVASLTTGLRHLPAGVVASRCWSRPRLRNCERALQWYLVSGFCTSPGKCGVPMTACAGCLGVLHRRTMDGARLRAPSRLMLSLP